MDSKRAFIPIIVVATVIAFWLAAPWILSTGEDARTLAAGQTGVQCTTGGGATECDVGLSSPSAYSDMTAVTVTETDPGSLDRTAGTTLGTDAQTLTVTGLAGGTTYTFDLIFDQVRPSIPPLLDLALRNFAYVMWVSGTLFIAAILFAVRATQ